MTCFFTVVDRNFLPGALALMRSVQKYFPESHRIVRLHGDYEGGLQWAKFCDVAEITSGQNTEMRPAEEYYDIIFSRYDIERLPGDYLIHIDADAVLTGRVDELLQVPDGKLGFVSERPHGYRLADQFVDDEVLDYVKSRYEVDPPSPSINCGVIAGPRDSWGLLWDKLQELWRKDTGLFRKSKHDQGVVQIALKTIDLWYEMPRHCNETKNEVWDDKRPTVLHFTKGNTRPWRTGSSRRDNSYPAFREWRKHSHVLDFTLNNTFWQELFWRSLDDIRPMVRRFK